MKRILAILIGLLVYSGAYAQDFEKETVHFETDKAELRTSEKQRIDAFLETLGDIDKVRFGVYGHTDSRGSIDYNLDLSEHRTESVMDYLMYRGVDASNVIADYFGEINPIAENSNDNGMADNRRVEIRAFEIPPAEIMVSNLTPNPYGFKEHNLVKPILPKLVKERQVFTVDVDLPVSILTESGTRVKIPANALVDANGNPVQGEVNISYREYHEPLEVLLSGIPMTFDSAGARHQFQTAGMFELQAVKEGEEVFIKPGEKIKIEMQSMDDESDYNLYALDETQGWQNINTAPANPPVQWTQNMYPSWAYQYFMNYQRNGSNILEQIDPCTFNEQFDDPGYYYTHKSDQVSDYRTIYRFTSGKRKGLLRRYGLLKIRTVRRHKGDPKDMVRFTVQQLTSPNTHHELRAFKNSSWVLIEPMNRTDFRKTFSYKKKYNDIRIIPSENGDYAILNLKGDEGYIQFKVYPSVPGIDDSEIAMQSFEKDYPRYEKALARRAKRYDRVTARKNKHLLRDYETLRKQNYKTIRDYMTDKEKEMTFSEWITYNQELMAEMREDANKARANSFTLTRSLAIDGFGVYNCDQIYRLQEPVSVIAQFNANDNDKKIKWKTAYVLDANLRGVLTYHSKGYAGVSKPGVISLDPKTVQAMVVTDNSDNLSIIRKPEIGNLFAEGEVHTFSVKELDEVTSVGELKEMLGLAN